MDITKRIWNWEPTELKYASQLGVRKIIGLIPEQKANPAWDFLELLQIKKMVESYGLELAAIESPPAALMREIVRAGPHRDQAITEFCTCLEHMSQAGIRILCYNFAIHPTWGRWREGLSGGGRGDAGIMSFDSELVSKASIDKAGPVSAKEMWRRLTYFLERVVPVAEKTGVKLACHPDDPPVPVVRGAAQILSSVAGMKRLIQTVPSSNHGLLFCQGTVAEMGEDVFAAMRYFLKRRKIFVVHFRNIHRLGGRGLKYDEVFIDEGDVDMAKAMQVYAELNYDGLIDPDHAPVMETDTQFGRQRGFAFAIGYMTALRQVFSSKSHK